MRCSITTLALATLLARGALAAPDGVWSTRTVAGMGTQLYTPRAAGTIGRGRGLIVGLHGCTQTGDTLKQRGNWEPAADRHGVVVALPSAPNGGVLAGCWDYYGANHARTGRHDGPVFELVRVLLADAALGIDPAQVYVAGLSSGGGEAMVLGCLAPDVFAGVGINAGPAVGTDSSQFATVAVDANTARATCMRLAGGAAASFATQLASVIYGSEDHVVAPGYGPIDADVFRGLHGGAALTESAIAVNTLEGYMPNGTGTLWSDAAGPRVSLIRVQGMGHAFPAGSGAGPEISFVASAGPSWPMYLATLFTAHNRRVQGGMQPRPDAGVVAPVDAGSRDASRRSDAAVLPRSDAGTSADAGLEPTPGTREDVGGGCACTRARADLRGALALLALAHFLLRKPRVSGA